ncbi:JmjC domain-containing protein [Streptomyces olivaceoviridis]|uniref:JmjC domain-containing protein n=1 Tax=Streptomyces olivaceoviridis TaxID=1921 RepID=UPI0036FEAE3A
MKAPTLSRWVGDTDTFFVSYWRRAPFVFTPEGGAFSPFTLADVDTALESGYFRTLFLDMWSDGRPVPHARYSDTRTVGREVGRGFPDGEKVHALLGEGASIILRSVDQWHRPTREVVAALADEMGLPVEAFFSVTPAGGSGLPLHRDDSDVFVIQLAGSKSWRIHEGPADGHWRVGKVRDDEAQPAVVFETVLRPGEVMYVPRGFAHCATGQEGLSVHLSLGVREVVAADLAESLRARLTADVLVAPMPVTDEAVAATAATLLARARRRLDELTPDDLVALAREDRVAMMPAVRTSASLVEFAARAAL